jgi:outer membrane protein TolC
MKNILCSLMILSLALESRGLAQTNTNVPSVLTLADAQKLALQNHPQIAAANYRALAAQEVVKQTRAGFFQTQMLTRTPWAQIPKARESWLAA